MLSYLMIAIFVVVAIALGIGLSALVRAQNRTTCRLELANQGNIQSRYELRAEEPSNTLEFQFMLNGAGLPQRQVAHAAELAQKAETGSLASPGQKPGAIAQAARQAQGAGGAFAALLGNVGALVPGSAGARLRQASMQIGKAQYTASQMETVSNQVAGLATGKPAPPPVGTGPEAGGLAWSAPHFAPAATALPAWVQTPFVEPGGSLLLDLLINRVKAYQANAADYRVKLMSRSLEQAGAPWVVEECSVRIAGLSGLRNNYRLALVLGVATVALILASVICLSNLGIATH